MSFGEDEDILQDFLVEVGEIIERLSQQLVDLEQRPNDTKLLNAIFRGFHTIKGGAGFLSLVPMVECCHLTENLFDILRTGKRKVTSELMDVVLQALDNVNTQFKIVSTREVLPPVDPTLIAALERLVSCEDLMEELPEDITDDEFEILLDQLHGKGRGPTKGKGLAKNKGAEKNKEKPGADDLSVSEFTEFNSLLDQLDANNKAPSIQVKPEKKFEAETTFVAEIAAEPPALKAITHAGQDHAVETTVRVDTQRLDDIMNMVGELVLVRNRLMCLGNASTNEALIKAVANLDVVTADLQTSVMKTRMQPIKKVFSRFPRVVRDLARHLKKEINLELMGEETGLDKNLVDALADPLIHLVRNSVDHGIELPEVRLAHGKSQTGLVILSARQEGDHILLCISDDGAGMDPLKLRRVAIEKGLYDEESAAHLTDAEAFNLIFMPGFSTKKEISEVSGRGVGMDVVKTKINQLNGTIEIQSNLGKGTRFTIKVPLTLAIMPTLMIMIGKQTFALPLASVNEIFHMDLSRSHVVDGQDCIAIRDQAIPLFYMKEWLVKGGAQEARQTFAHVVIVTVETRRVGFVVDQLIGQEEVVIKPLGKMLQGTPGMAGATITGDGSIALILDIPSLLRRYARGKVSSV
jgi:two-component system, chemotaxis family, sensor kinase CheA